MALTSAERSRAWRARNPAHARELKREQDARRLERDPDYFRRYAAANREAYRGAVRKLYADRRQQVFDHYGWTCACCGTAKRPSIDHKAGNGAEHRRELGAAGKQASSRQVYIWLVRNGFPPGFQTLCVPCNVSKADGESCRLHAGGDAHATDVPR